MTLSKCFRPNANPNRLIAPEDEIEAKYYVAALKDLKNIAQFLKKQGMAEDAPQDNDLEASKRLISYYYDTLHKDLHKNQTSFRIRAEAGKINPDITIKTEGEPVIAKIKNAGQPSTTQRHELSFFIPKPQLDVSVFMDDHKGDSPERRHQKALARHYMESINPRQLFIWFIADVDREFLRVALDLNGKKMIVGICLDDTKFYRKDTLLAHKYELELEALQKESDPGITIGEANKAMADFANWLGQTLDMPLDPNLYSKAQVGFFEEEKHYKANRGKACKKRVRSPIRYLSLAF